MIVSPSISYVICASSIATSATSPSQSNAVQCRGTQNSAATFSYTPGINHGWSVGVETRWLTREFSVPYKVASP